VISINGFTITTLATSSQCPNPNSLSINDANGLLYAACYGGGVIVIGNSMCPPGFGIGSIFSCALCAPGTFNSLGSLYCPPCPAGTYASSCGSVSCSNCMAGTWSSEGNAICNGFCWAGRYGNSSTSVSPNCAGPCTAGYFCPNGSSSSTALECGSVGVYCPEGSAFPVVAQNGYFTIGGNDMQTQTSLQICDSGYFCVGGIRTECSAGTYSPLTGASSCETCAPGSVANQTGSSTCFPCSPGSYVPHSAFQCLLCTPGTYSSNPGATQCDSCVPGRYSPNFGSSECASCSPGSFSENGFFLCLSCPPSTYAISNGSSSCLNCDSANGLVCSRGTVSVTSGSWGYMLLLTLLAIVFTCQ